jgi:hypothetical protein
MDGGPADHRGIYFPVVSAICLLGAVNTDPSLIFQNLSCWTMCPAVAPNGTENPCILRFGRHGGNSNTAISISPLISFGCVAVNAEASDAFSICD